MIHFFWITLLASWGLYKVLFKRFKRTSTAWGITNCFFYQSSISASLRSTVYGLRSAVYGLRSAVYDLRSTVCGLRSTVIFLLTFDSGIEFIEIINLIRPSVELLNSCAWIISTIHYKLTLRETSYLSVSKPRLQNVWKTNRWEKE